MLWNPKGHHSKTFQNNNLGFFVQDQHSSSILIFFCNKLAVKLDATNKPFLDSESSCNKPTARGGAVSGIFRVPGTKFVFGFCPMTEWFKGFWIIYSTRVYYCSCFMMKAFQVMGLEFPKNLFQSLMLSHSSSKTHSFSTAARSIRSALSANAALCSLYPRHFWSRDVFGQTCGWGWSSGQEVPCDILHCCIIASIIPPKVHAKKNAYFRCLTQTYTHKKISNSGFFNPSEKYWSLDIFSQCCEKKRSASVCTIHLS